MTTKSLALDRLNAVKTTGKALIQLLKPRLTFLVSVSGVFGLSMASGLQAFWWQYLLIGLAGFLVTGASNVLNQIFERELDAKMQRTSARPLPQGVLSDGAAVLYAMVLAIIGVALLGRFFNLPAALLGIIALLSYAFVYTPLKRITPFSVFVGAIPGALPPLIGWVAITGSIDEGGLILFAFQFFWQFPHFWAIAWLLDEDYQKAGFKMLPTSDGRNKNSARLILVYTLALVFLAFFPWASGLVGWVGATVLMIAGALFAWPAWQLWRKQEMKAARQLMFASFIYLPVIQITFLIG